MKICFIPIDNRPVCYNLVKDIVSIDESFELYLPPREFLGDLKKNANIQKLLEWLKSAPKCDAIILSLDTIAYGGLIPSRRSTETFEEIKNRIDLLKQILKEKNAKIYAFSSIMRISNNNYNEEEKEYWKDFGKKIFEYSYSGGLNNDGIPQDILDDYLATRERNFNINKLYLEWQKEGFFDTLIFSKDDCAEFGFNVNEAQELKRLGGIVKTGADEIPLSLLSRSIKKDIKIFIKYTEPDSKNLISNYEDISIEKSVLGQLELSGFKVAHSESDSDVILIVNNFQIKQGELVMGWDTPKFSGNLSLPNKPYIIADVRFANGGDNLFVDQLLPQIDLNNFFGYAGWNTSANTLGSLLAGLKLSFNAQKFNIKAFKKLQITRFLDDWAYQANVRAKIDKPCDIYELMLPYEETLLNVFDEKALKVSKYIFTWDRRFEVEIVY